MIHVHVNAGTPKHLPPQVLTRCNALMQLSMLPQPSSQHLLLIYQRFQWLDFPGASIEADCEGVAIMHDTETSLLATVQTLPETHQMDANLW